MAKQSPKERAARKRAARKTRRASSGGGNASGGGGLMTSMRGGFKTAVHGKRASTRKRLLTGWLPVLIFVIAVLVLIRRLGLF